MNDQNLQGEQEVLHEILTSLQKVDQDARFRLLKVAADFFKPNLLTSNDDNSLILKTVKENRESYAKGGFVEDRSMSPKEFLLEKQPKSDVERIACLAYYLTHYRDMPYFKTIDLSALNTEAAQIKFSNASVSATNALSQRYLTTATKGKRQLSAAGELFVQALPDRDSAHKAFSSDRPRKLRLSKGNKVNKSR